MSYISLAIFRTGRPYYYHRFTGEKYDQISSQTEYTTQDGVEYFDSIEKILCNHNTFTVTIKDKIGDKYHFNTILINYIYERGIFSTARWDPARILQAIHAHVQFWPQLSKLLSYNFMDPVTIRKGMIGGMPMYYEVRYGTVCNPDAVRDCISEPIQILESVKNIMYIDRKDNSFRVQLTDDANRHVTVLVCYDPVNQIFTDLMYDPTKIIPSIIGNPRFYIYFNSFVPEELRINSFIYNETELEQFAESVQIVRQNIVQESYVYDMRTGEKLKYQIDKPIKLYDYVDEITKVCELNKNIYTVTLTCDLFNLTITVEYVGGKFLVNKYDPHKIIRAIRKFQENPYVKFDRYIDHNYADSANQSRITQWNHSFTPYQAFETLGVLRAGKAPNGQITIYDSRNGEIEEKTYHNILPRPYLNFTSVQSILRDVNVFVVTVKVEDRIDFITVKYDKNLHCFDVPKYEPTSIICAILFEESCMPYFIEQGHPSFKDYVAPQENVTQSSNLLGRFRTIPRLSLDDIKGLDVQIENDKSDTDAQYRSSPESNDTINIGYEVDVTNDANDQMTDLNDQNNQDHYFAEMIRMRNQGVREPSETGTVMTHHNSSDSDQLTHDEYKVLYAYQNFWIKKFGICDKSIKQRIPESERAILDLILDNVPVRIEEPVQEIRPDIQKILDKFNCKNIRSIMMDEARMLLTDEEYKIYQEALEKELQLKKIADRLQQINEERNYELKQKLQSENKIRDNVTNSDVRSFGEFGYLAKHTTVRTAINIHMQSILDNKDTLEDIVGKRKPIKDVPREDNLEIPETKFDVTLVLPDTVENNKTTEAVAKPSVQPTYPSIQTTYPSIQPPPYTYDNPYLENYASRAYQAESMRAYQTSNLAYQTNKIDVNDDSSDEDMDKLSNEESRKIDIIHNNRAEMINIINSDSATGIIVSLACLSNNLNCSMTELINLFELNPYIENAETIRYENIPHIKQRISVILDKIDYIIDARRHKLFYNARITEQKARTKFLIDAQGDKQFAILLRTFITMIDADYNKFLACYGVIELNNYTIKLLKYQLKKQLKQQAEDREPLFNFWGA